MLHFQNYLSIIIPLKILKSPNPHTLPSAMVNSGKRRLSVNAKKSGLSPSPKAVMKNKNIRKSNLLEHFPNGPCSIALNLNTAILNPNPSRTDTPEQPINPRGTWRVFFFNKLI